MPSVFLRPLFGMRGALVEQYLNDICIQQSEYLGSPRSELKVLPPLGTEKLYFCECLPVFNKF